MKQKGNTKYSYNILYILPTDSSEEVVIGSVEPLSGPACGAWEHAAGVAVVLQTVCTAPPAPHVSLQQVLVRPLLPRPGVELGVRQHAGPAGVPVVPPGLGVQLGPPAPRHEGDGVPGMVPHGVQALVRLQPLRHCRPLPLRDAAVQVPGHHHRH